MHFDMKLDTAQHVRAILAQNLRYLDTDLASIRLRIVARELSCVRSARWPNARDFCKREQFFFRGGGGQDLDK